MGVIPVLKWLKAKKLGWALAFGPKESRPEVARALGELGTSAVSNLIAALQHDEDLAVCIAAAESLGRIRDRRSIEGMMSRLWTAPEPLADSIVKASRACDEADTSRLLAEKFLHGEDRISRVASRFLHQIGATSIETLQRGLSDESTEVRGRACGILEELGWPLRTDEQRLMAAMSRGCYAVAMAMGSPGVAAVFDFLRRSNHEAAKTVTADLAVAGAAEPLAAICEEQTLNRYRHVALTAIGDIGDPKAIASLVSAASRTSDDEVRSAMLNTLSKLGDTAIRELTGLLGNAAEALQDAAAHALCRIHEGRRIAESAAMPNEGWRILASVNLRRWNSAGEPQAWVSARRGRWDHQDWLSLLDRLRSTSFWPMNESDVGQILEEARASHFRDLVQKVVEADNLERSTRRLAERCDELRRRDSGRTSELSRLAQRYEVELPKHSPERESVMKEIQYLSGHWGLTDDLNRAKQAESDLPRVRKRLKELEQECCHPAAVGPAIERLADGTFEVQVAMARLLGRIGDPRGIAWLQSCAGKSIHPECQEAVAEALRDVEVNGLR